jgi:hypothetical protein
MSAKRSILLACLAAMGASGVPAGGMKTLTIADDTQLDPVVTTAGPNVGSAVGATGSGWVALVTLKGVTTTGACDATKLTVTVTDPGYDTSGNVTTVTRTITGVAQIRRQYPNGASKYFGTDGAGDTIFYVSLDDTIYAGSTIVSATLASGFYTGSVAGNTGTVFTNSSTRTYTKPLFGWLNHQAEIARSTSFAFEAVAFHRHARAGQQVACVKVSASDGTNSTPTVTVSTPTLSTKLTQGNIPEVWAGTLNLSGLTQATVVNANALVYPWIGDSTAVLNLATDGVAWPTSLPVTPLRIFNDAGGTYGTAYAYVQVGASGGAVSANATTAATTPFPTIVAAMAAVKTWNNTNKAHNDLGGSIIRLMDASGSAATHTIGSAPTNSPGTAYCEIQKDPAATGSVSVTWSAQEAFPNMMRWTGGINFLSASATGFMLLGPNTSRAMVSVDGCTFDLTAAAASGITWYDLKYLTNITFAGSRTCTMQNLVTATSGIALGAGWVSATNTSIPSSTNDQPKVMVGCVMPKFAIAMANTQSDGEHGRIMYNNKLFRAIFNYPTATATTINYGIANVQNLFEHDGSDSGVICMNFFADGDETTINNYIEMHVTAVGNRCSRMYNDATADKFAPNGVIKRGVSMFSIVDNYNNKSDTFNSGAGSTGNWAYHYSVGNVGYVSLFGAVNRGPTEWPHNDNFDNPYLGSAWLPSSMPNLTYTGSGGLALTQAQVMAIFNNYTVGPQASPALGGDYHINTSNPNSQYVRNRVPAGRAVLKYALDGVARKNDGTGAAGCYEA